MGNTKTLLKKLESARDALDRAIAELSSLEHGAKESGEVAAQCLSCKKPIYAGEEMRRGVHLACYNRIFPLIRSGEATWEELEKAGLVGPRGIGGRPAKTDLIDQVRAKIDARPVRRKNKK